tara:strand:- start:1729 stop:2904 length:1176 start_codon:yes stop_codon:yes gene_type:complete
MAKKILITGCGYVGLSQAILFHKNNKVDILEIDEQKVNLISNRKSPLLDKEFIDYFNKNEVELRAFKNIEDINQKYDFVLICLPTDFDNTSAKLKTDLIEEYIDFFIRNTNAHIILKSTLPIGFTESQILKYNTKRISFSPEFLREGRALDDVMNPTRIVHGPKNKSSIMFDKIIKNSLPNYQNETRFMESSEAEAVKLFSNSFLALRVAFFNEVDNFSLKNNLNSKNIIEGICDDNRIGMFYNNPSFGFGGYCLPKDSKELSNHLKINNVPASLINTINLSNSERKEFISKILLKISAPNIGIYRINMKTDSSNFRDSAIIDILKILIKNKKNILIYEPLIEEDEFYGCKVEGDFKKFKRKSDLIIANRLDENIIDVSKKIFSRDIYTTN